MAKHNPSNPFSNNEEQTRRSVAPPIAKAKVVNAYGTDDTDSGYHTVRVRVYGENSAFQAPVLTSMRGSAELPPVGSDVAVAYGPNEKPWVIGYWYPGDGEEPPDHKPGERVIGNALNDSYIKMSADGSIDIVTEGNKEVNIDHQSASIFLDNDYVVPDDDTYYKVPYDTIEDDPEDLYDEANNTIVTLASGLHRLSASVEIPSAGQNNQYSLAIFVNGTERKRVSRQSSTNEALSVQVQTQIRLENNSTVDVRIKNGSNSNRTVLGSPVTTEFNVRRAGI
jgi:hypothetical protein